MAHGIFIHRITAIRLERIEGDQYESGGDYYRRTLRIKTTAGDFDLHLFANGDEGALVFEEVPEETEAEAA